ncbi:hypothetical protein SAMN05216304_113107 [Bosea sp. OK403]|uniref:hypothetical protein n=1 Tax=Bosea sp. OK403 TaxID=1855286 RepID=UPI0008E5C4A5|nr:hypothetical protein [Bosea sp. OK403]SFJ75279.1 hypothetical protein SAMN05216304_113107 [Bosea sp. OK403]
MIEQKLQLLATGRVEDASLTDQLLAFPARLHRIVLVPEIIGLERAVIAEAKQFLNSPVACCPGSGKSPCGNLTMSYGLPCRTTAAATG